ncbi:DUF4252 domain-containing protein [Kordia sp.]|uniref:DUF4252 domain-containing protein n=1 Tax=Kordia sp. TaxID=1965332 RepID=UPI003D2E3BE1
MKKTLLILSLLLFFSCGSYYKMANFYNAHKNDDKVTAVQVPRFMFTVLKGLSPEMNSVLGTVNDLRFIQLQPQDQSEEKNIQREINQLTNDRFTDIFRKNDDFKRTLISVREVGNSIKEVIVHKTASGKHTVLYMSGNFNPTTIQEYAETGKFDNLTQSITQQYLWNTTAPKSY